MQRVPANPIEGIVTYCPECGEEVIETSGDSRDVVGPDVAEEGELECPSCGTFFEYFIDEY